MLRVFSAQMVSKTIETCYLLIMALLSRSVGRAAAGSCLTLLVCVALDSFKDCRSDGGTC